MERCQHGVNFPLVVDGWWDEACTADVGRTIERDAPTGDVARDAFDAEAICAVLVNKVIRGGRVGMDSVSVPIDGLLAFSAVCAKDISDYHIVII